MKTFNISGKTVEFDESKRCLDFYLQDGEQKLVEIDFEAMLEALASGQETVDEGLREYMLYLSRWTKDAPRKRFYHDMKARGFNVISGEQFFDADGGEDIIDRLENTGKFAGYFLKEVFGKE